MFSLVADYDTSSSTADSEDEKEPVKTSTTVRNHSPLLLPSADALLNKKGSTKPTGDVFNNPFLEAEKLEIHKLQKHVQMVESENHLLQKNGRKICWNNRKGRCRFGNKCKYAHDSDLVEAKEFTDINKQILSNKVKTSSKSRNANFDAKSDFTEKGKTSTKRSGLGDSIVPMKRVMKS